MNKRDATYECFEIYISNGVMTFDNYKKSIKISDIVNIRLSLLRPKIKYFRYIILGIAASIILLIFKLPLNIICLSLLAYISISLLCVIKLNHQKKECLIISLVSGDEIFLTCEHAEFLNKAKETVIKFLNGIDKCRIEFNQCTISYSYAGSVSHLGNVLERTTTSGSADPPKDEQEGERIERK